MERFGEKSLGHDTTLEIGYQGERGFHLQQAHLINNALPGPGAHAAAPALSHCDIPPRER